VDYYAHTLPMLLSQLTRDLFRQNRKDCDLRLVSTTDKEDMATFTCLFELRCPRFFAALRKETFVTRRPGLADSPVPNTARLPLSDLKKLVTDDILSSPSHVTSSRLLTANTATTSNQRLKRRSNTVEEKLFQSVLPLPLMSSPSGQHLLRERALSSPSIQFAPSTTSKLGHSLSGSTSDLDRLTDRLTSELVPDRLPTLPQVPSLPGDPPRTAVVARARRVREAEKEVLSIGVDPMAAMPSLPPQPALPSLDSDPSPALGRSLLGSSRNASPRPQSVQERPANAPTTSNGRPVREMRRYARVCFSLV
jgi:hypothetical protein